MRTAFRTPFALVWLGLMAAAIVAVPARRATALDVNGEQIYAAKCASCHGAQGEGTTEYPDRLEGGLSVAQLDLLIGETMPEDDPGTLPAAESQAVAQFLHAAFYSPVARQRNRPARVELARLTVNQHRLAVADLLGSFRPSTKQGGEHGLQAEYYRGRRIGGRRERAASRIDALVDFDFGTAAPVPEIKEPHEFSIRWEGSVIPVETGEYEFVVRTEHATRLWVNDLEQAAIDAWVKSGDDTEFTTTLFLLGGRAVPLRLEFTKAKQGVDDSKKQKKKPTSAPATIGLLWKRPHGVLTPIPQRHLLPTPVAPSTICATRFPPDDRSYGWVRGTSVSKAWDQATTEAAITTAGAVVEQLDRLAGTRADAADRPARLRTFCQQFVERAFRQPLDDAASQLFIERQFAATEDPELAVKRVVMLALKSPRFLFREVGGPPAGDKALSYAAAARLSFGLWDSIPDRSLNQAAAAGKLVTPAQIAAEARRMLADPRAQAKLRGFLMTWLHVETHPELSKDDQQFPSFNATTSAHLRTSLELFLDEILQSPHADYRQLLVDDEVFLNGQLAEMYGRQPIQGAAFTKVKLDDGQRAGILTHPYLMANLAHLKESSPIHRGVFLARDVLGKTLRPPPDFFAPLAPDLHPDLSTRARVSLQTKPASCQKCHSAINALGFTLEHFDAIGRYRERDRENPIDATGGYRTRDGQQVALQGARGLAEFLAESPETHAAFTERLFHYLVQQPARAYGPSMLENLRRSFADNEFNIRELAVQIMVATALVGRETVQAAATGQPATGETVTGHPTSS